MAYVEHSAIASLRPLVECAWTRRGDGSAVGPLRHLVLPDGCVDVIVDLDRRRVFVVGTMTVAREVVLLEPAELVALRFLPGGASPVLGLPLSELTDGEVELGELRPDADEILAALDGLPVEAAAVALQEALAGRPMPGGPPPPWWRIAVDGLTAARSPRVGELSERLGISRQYLGRRCRELAGVGPKRLARVARLRRLLRLVDAGAPADWADAAVAAGYYDQAHMTGEVRELTGRTPGQLRPEAAWSAQ